MPDELKMRLDLKMSPGSFQAHAFSKRQKQYEDHYMGVIKNCFMTVLFLTCVKRSPSKMLPPYFTSERCKCFVGYSSIRSFAAKLKCNKVC